MTSSPEIMVSGSRTPESRVARYASRRRNVPQGSSESLRFQDAKRDHPGQPLRLQARPSFRPEPSGLGGAPEPPDGRLRCITSTMTRRGVAMAFQGYLARCHSLDRTETPLPLLGTTRPALRAPWLAANVSERKQGLTMTPVQSCCFLADDAIGSGGARRSPSPKRKRAETASLAACSAAARRSGLSPINSSSSCRDKGP